MTTWLWPNLAHMYNLQKTEFPQKYPYIPFFINHPYIPPCALRTMPPNILLRYCRTKSMAARLQQK